MQKRLRRLGVSCRWMSSSLLEVIATVITKLLLEVFNLCLEKRTLSGRNENGKMEK